MLPLVQTVHARHAHSSVVVNALFPVVIIKYNHGYECEFA